MAKPSYEQLKEKITLLEKELELLRSSRRNKPEETLRESDEMFYRAFSSNPSLLAISTIEDGRFIDINRQFGESTGYGREEIIGKTAAELALFPFPGERDVVIGEVREKGRARNVEVHVRTRDGRILTGLFNAEIVTIGGRECWLTMMNDISDRKMAEEALLESEEFLRSLANSIPGVVYQFYVRDGGEMGFYYISERAAGFLGQEKVTGDVFERFITGMTPEDRARFVDSIKESARTNKTWEFEGRFTASNGNERYFSGISHPRRSGGEVVFNGLMLDITGRRRAEERLKWQLAMNMALAGLSGSIIAQSFTIRDIAAVALEYARLLTESAHGFVSEIDARTRENVIHAMDGALFGESNPGWKPSGPDMRYGGLWGHVLNTGEAFFSNDPSGHEAWTEPQGGVEIRSFLGVPVLLNHAVVGQIVLANADRDYSADDLITARRLASLYAMAISRIRNEEELRESLTEKEVLIKELHHRVKNNLQVVSSLLALQSNRIDSDVYRGYFQESQNRVHAMALIHEKLYNSAALARIDFSRYLDDLTRHLFYSYNINPHKVQLRIDVRDVYLGIDTAVPCAMIINELVSNSLKHGFPGDREGEIVVGLSRNDGYGYTLTVNDNGIGIPAGSGGRISDSLGMQIVTSLTRQIKGNMDVSGEGGTRITITF